MQRPDKLSDPNHDFSDIDLRKIISVEDEKMGFTELICIFQGNLPAANYDEAVYFLPILFRYIESNILTVSQNGIGTLLDYFCMWCDDNNVLLTKDGNWNKIESFFLNIIKILTCEFHVYWKNEQPFVENYANLFSLLDPLNKLNYCCFAWDKCIGVLKENWGYSSAAWLILISENFTCFGIFNLSKISAAIKEIDVVRAWDLLDIVLSESIDKKFWEYIICKNGI